MSITDNWSQTPMLICDSSASEQAKQLHMTVKKTISINI
jgi:RNA polymerase subunit RPABC4/transcription elongation factor Spt4